MDKVRLREVKKLAQGYMAGMRWRWDPSQDPSDFGPTTVFLKTNTQAKNFSIEKF